MKSSSHEAHELLGGRELLTVVRVSLLIEGETRGQPIIANHHREKLGFHSERKHDGDLTALQICEELVTRLNHYSSRPWAHLIGRHIWTQGRTF